MKNEDEVSRTLLAADLSPLQWVHDPARELDVAMEAWALGNTFRVMQKDAVHLLPYALTCNGVHVFRFASVEEARVETALYHGQIMLARLRTAGLIPPTVLFGHTNSELQAQRLGEVLPLNFKHADGEALEARFLGRVYRIETLPSGWFEASINGKVTLGPPYQVQGDAMADLRRRHGAGLRDLLTGALKDAWAIDGLNAAIPFGPPPGTATEQSRVLRWMFPLDFQKTEGGAFVARFRRRVYEIVLEDDGFYFYIDGEMVTRHLNTLEALEKLKDFAQVRHGDDLFRYLQGLFDVHFDGPKKVEAPAEPVADLNWVGPRLIAGTIYHTLDAPGLLFDVSERDGLAQLWCNGKFVREFTNAERAKLFAIERLGKAAPAPQAVVLEEPSSTPNPDVRDKHRSTVLDTIARLDAGATEASRQTANQTEVETLAGLAGALRSLLALIDEGGRA